MPRPLPEVNSSSQADIAFMLLIFFLVTTTMDVDSGISRKLPPMPDPNQPKDDNKQVNERNVFEVLINKSDKLAVEGKGMNVRMLRESVKEFFLNPYNKEDLPEKTPVTIEYFGEVMVSKGVVSLQNDRGTSYGMYIKVQNEIAAAVNELRDQAAMRKFGKKYEDVGEDEQKAIRTYFPNAISEAEPKKLGGE